jgi:glycosyltransferase involved in cell wall biosynthesis
VIVTYDLRYVTDHFPGIGTHAWELLNALLAQPGDDRYRVIWNPALPCARFDLTPLRTHPRVEWLECDVLPLHWSTARRTGALLRRVGGDVYFSPFSLCPEGGGPPAVITLHDVLPLVPAGGANVLRRFAFSYALRGAARAAAVLTSSEFSRGEIHRLTRIPASLVRVVRLGVTSPPQGEPRRPAAAPSGPFALTVGANRPHKNHAVLAAAWRSFGAAPPLTLVAVGPTEARFPGWETLARTAQGIVPLGRVPQAELEWLYRNATLVLHPSRYEGFGFPLLEAASRGVPAVCSDIPALRELGEGVARFLPADDVSAWAGAVRELAADAPARERMRAAGLALAAANDYAHCARRVRDVLEQVAGRAA